MAKARRKPGKDPLAQEITAIAVATLGAVLLVGLLVPHSGWFGETIGLILRNVAGLGAWCTPFLLGFIGYVLATGKGLPTSKNRMIGGLILFLVFVTWCQFARTPDIRGAWTQHYVDEVIQGGGYLGLTLSYVLYRAFGVSSHILLAAVAVVSILLITGLSLVETAEAAVSRARELLKARPQPVKSEKKLVENGKRVVQGVEPAEKKAGPGLLAKLTPAFLVAKPDEEGAKSDATAGKAAVIIHSGEVSKPSVVKAPMPITNDGSEFKLPPITLLKEPAPPQKRAQAELNYKINKIEQTLEEFKIEADVVEVSHGPTVTRYEVQLAPGIKVSKIVSLADNLAMALAAIDVRVEAPIPGKCAIGVEVPNDNPTVVTLREVVDVDQFRSAASKLTFPLGKDVAGVPRYADLTKMPHMLIAGSTNSGKSVCLNALIAGLLYRATPREVKFILIDPKRVELSLFDGIPHLCSPVVKDVRQAAGILRSVLKEMDHRYDLFVKVSTRNFEGYNSKVKPEERIPYLVVVVDELADLMMQAGPEVEFCICRLAQLARATGIHLVIATQRPSVDVITGTIKANISSRISFAVSSQIDSRTILDAGGAERLIGRGDMLFKPIDASKPTRVQGCLVSEKEIEDLVAYLKEQESPDYTMEPVQVGDGPSGGGGDDDAMTDEIYEPAVRMIVSTGYASTSMIQRRFKIGYTRAARMVDAMEQQGIVGPLDGAKPREVLITNGDIDRIFGQGLFTGDKPTGEQEAEG
jgi:S-DNA-T family DNA segregation ATPase FtsK/SpoIIIE